MVILTYSKQIKDSSTSLRHASQGLQYWYSVICLLCIAFTKSNKIITASDTCIYRQVYAWCMSNATSWYSLPKTRYTIMCHRLTYPNGVQSFRYFGDRVQSCRSCLLGGLWWKPRLARKRQYHWIEWETDDQCYEALICWLARCWFVEYDLSYTVMGNDALQPGGWQCMVDAHYNHLLGSPCNRPWLLPAVMVKIVLMTLSIHMSLDFYLPFFAKYTFIVQCIQSVRLVDCQQSCTLLRDMTYTSHNSTWLIKE